MVTLLRHTAVASHWQGRCYGASDAGLSAAGIVAAQDLALRPPEAWRGVTRIHASPSRRAWFLGRLLSRRLGLPLDGVAALRERDFGTWEGQSWDAIHAAEGDSMMGMIDDPGGFRPGGGETTAELAARVVGWFRALPPGEGVLAVTHGGPVAALRGSLAGLPARDWLALVPALGEATDL
ncbi:histidine phosphatase family protein [Falsiroseomonas sp. E2-1-a20]|uniref:histidine phosphatase family protein n=1 Tax=Falsiroseomonas sp. E2-1-a20 TaxID=3239300 RepID=UPI003F4199C5